MESEKWNDGSGIGPWYLYQQSVMQMATGKEQEPIRILLVEDDVGLEQLWRFVVSKLSRPCILDWVTTANSAEQAITKLRGQNNSYGVIICDLFLSGGRTGLDLWRCHKEDPSEFVFNSGVSAEKFAIMLTRENANLPFLEKPLNLRKCVEVLETRIQRRRTEGHMTEPSVSATWSLQFP